MEDQSVEFEVFVNRMAPVTTEPYVTIQKRGMLSINASAHVLLGAPSAVELMYDSRRKLVALRAAPPSAPHAYPLRPVGGKSAGPFLVSGTAFLKYFGIAVDTTRRWMARSGNGLVWIDLKEVGVPVTSNRAAAPAHQLRHGA